MFTERFIKVPSLVFSPENEELMGKSDNVACSKKINPMRIESYGEVPPNESFHKDNKIWTLVVMQSGDTFTATITVEEFEKLINDFAK